MVFVFYHLVKFYLSIFLEFYFEVTYINLQNVPKQGPTILYGNHNNHVSDGVTLMFALARPLRIITALKQMRRPGIGHYLRAARTIGVERIEDVPVRHGKGKIKEIFSGIMYGQNSQFSETDLPKGSLIILENGISLKIKKVISKTEAQIESYPDTTINQSYTFKTKPSHEQTYHQIWNSLNNSQCVNIYPEGSSHDFYQMKPLKAGICHIALGAIEKYGIDVKLVPCGFNHYKQNYFRSKIIVVHGQAFSVPKHIIDLYKTNYKEAVQQLLTIIDENIKKLKVQFDSLSDFPSVLLARQLYTLQAVKEVSIEQKLQLNRRFANWFMVARTHPQYMNLIQKIIQFRNFLDKHGISVNNQIKDISIRFIFAKLCIKIIQIAFWIILMSPFLLICGPAIVLVNYLTQKERIYWKKRSQNQQEHLHLVSTYKCFLLSLCYPLIFVLVSILFFCFLQNLSKAVLSCILFLIFQYLSTWLCVKAYDKCVLCWISTKFIIIRLFNKSAYFYFVKTRANLQKKIFNTIQLRNLMIPNVSDNGNVKGKIQMII